MNLSKFGNISYLTKIRRISHQVDASKSDRISEYTGKEDYIRLFFPRQYRPDIFNRYLDFQKMENDLTGFLRFESGKSFPKFEEIYSGYASTFDRPSRIIIYNEEFISDILSCRKLLPNQNIPLFLSRSLCMIGLRK